MDAVFPELNTQIIDIHLIQQGEHFRLKELTHDPKAVLMDVLEVESATCILEEDRDAYEFADWEERQMLEIPVNFKSIVRHQSQYIRLDMGSMPFVIPQPPAEHEEWGLQLVEPTNFL